LVAAVVAVVPTTAWATSMCPVVRVAFKVSVPELVETEFEFDVNIVACYKYVSG
jgi:hypothetical protein